MSDATEGTFVECDCKPKWTYIKAGDLLYVPNGYYLVEKPAKGMLLYGVRKAVMGISPEAVAGFQTYIGVATEDGSASVEKMKQVLRAMESEADEAS